MPSECPGGDRQRRSDERVGDRRDRVACAEHPIERGEERAVSDRVMAPRVPEKDAPHAPVIRVAETSGDAERPEVVVVPVPDGLSGQRKGDAQSRSEGDDEEKRAEDRAAPRATGLGHAESLPRAASSSLIRRR